MPRKFVLRWLPHPQKMKNSRVIKWLGPLMDDPYLFHINRKSISQSFFIGLFCCYLPLPGHTLIAALMTLWWRSNLPLSLALIWISNPLTIAPMFYLSYQLGNFILGNHHHVAQIAISWDWITNQGDSVLMPLFLGSILCGLVLGGLGFLIVRILWRVTVLQNWTKRAQLRAKKLHAEKLLHKNVNPDSAP